MSLDAKAPPQWEAKTRPRTGVREYHLEVSREVFQKLFWLVKGKNAADKDSPERITVSGQAETILRDWLDEHWPTLTQFWNEYTDAEERAIDFVEQSTDATNRTGGQP